MKPINIATYKWFLLEKVIIRFTLKRIKIVSRNLKRNKLTVLRNNRNV